MALIKYLSSGAVKPPTSVTSAPKSRTAAFGFIVPDFTLGSLLLKNEHGHFYRLSWEGERDGKKPRALPPGSYTLTGYRLIRKDSEGRQWFVSATSHGIRKLEVRPGEEQKVAIDDTIRIQKALLPAGDRADLRMMIQGEHQSGLSIYRDGKRIPIAYRVTDGRGAVLAQGSMTYG